MVVLSKETIGDTSVNTQSFFAPSRLRVRSSFRVLACFVLTVINLPLHAQEKLSIEQAGKQPTIQMGRPIPSWWEVKIQGSALVEGRIEFKMKSGDRLLATHTTEDLALTGPQQRIRVLLPPVNDPEIDQLLLSVAFRGKKFNQDLGKHILRIAMSRSRSFMVLTASTQLATRRIPERERIVKRLAFESLAKDLEDSAKTLQASLEADDFPQDPHAYCAYEMVILFGDEFRLLKKSQLEALLAWVCAGGSLYLEPTSVLESYHVDFLRKLTEFGPSELIIQPDSRGRLIPGTILNDERLLRVTNGLGRIVLRVDDEPDAPVETPRWRGATAFLWRMHFDQAKLVAEQELANSDALWSLRESEFDPYGSYPMTRLASTVPTSTTELVNWLMPEGVRMVPLWVLGLILVTFVVWIGPVDYFGLGWLKARKYTWLTFPLATFLVTGLTVWITNRYMSSAETRRGLIVRDVGDDGSIVRTNRFELLFIASTRPVMTEVRKGIFSAMARGRSVIDDPSQRQSQQQMFQQPRTSYLNEESERSPARLQGRIPTDFTVTQDMSKWTPQLNRQLWIPGAKDEISVDWQELMQGLNITELLNRHTIDGELVNRVQQQFGPGALIALLGPEGKWASSHGGDWWMQRGNQPVHSGYRGRMSNTEGYLDMLPYEIQQQPELFRWLYYYSAGAPCGLFRLTSQVGPAGGSSLDDLPIYDTSDPDRSLLMVVVSRGDDFVVYRKLLRTVN